MRVYANGIRDQLESPEFWIAFAGLSIAPLEIVKTLEVENAQKVCWY
jgi:hypothetical protein